MEFPLVGRASAPPASLVGRTPRGRPTAPAGNWPRARASRRGTAEAGACVGRVACSLGASRRWRGAGARAGSCGRAQLVMGRGWGCRHTDKAVPERSADKWVLEIN
eukprot:scaffold12191_cov126-Isochrysis_galbana.AAC.4